MDGRIRTDHQSRIALVNRLVGLTTTDDLFASFLAMGHAFGDEKKTWCLADANPNKDASLSVQAIKNDSPWHEDPQFPCLCDQRALASKTRSTIAPKHGQCVHADSSVAPGLRARSVARSGLSSGAQVAYEDSVRCAERDVQLADTSVASSALRTKSVMSPFPTAFLPQLPPSPCKEVSEPLQAPVVPVAGKVPT